MKKNLFQYVLKLNNLHTYLIRQYMEILRQVPMNLLQYILPLKNNHILHVALVVDTFQERLALLELLIG